MIVYVVNMQHSHHLTGGEFVKKALSRLLFLIIGIAIGAGAYYITDNILLDNGRGSSGAQISTFTASPGADAGNKELTSMAQQIAECLKEKDYKTLSGIVHPEYGLVFSPYATINLSSNQYFMPSQVAAFADDTTIYVWGIYDGTGAPIEMTPAEYFEKFVFNLDYTSAPVIGINYIVKSGNSLENVTEVFPGAQYVDLHFPESYLDGAVYWSTLRLVFEYYNDDLMLTAIIHSEPTI